MLISALNFLLYVILNLLTMLFLLRFFMQSFQASFRNPLGLMVMTLTDFAVKPMREFIPSFKKWDLSTLLLAFLTQLLLVICVFGLKSFAMPTGGDSWLALLAASMLGFVRNIIDLFFYAILMQAILSWVNPNTPIAPVLESLTRPILAPIRRLVPAVNGIDFASFIALILLQMINFAFIGNLLARFS